MQITVDVRTLTAAERLHVAQFITDYPSADEEEDNDVSDDVIGFEITSVDEDEDEELAPSPVTSFGPALVPPPPTFSIDNPSPLALRVAKDGSVFVGTDGHPLPAIPAPPVPTPVMIDKAGLPWDDRIHSSSKAFVAEGTWRKKRGVDDAIIAQVEAELRAVMGIAAPSAVVPPPPPPPVPMIAANPGASVAAQISVPVEALPVTVVPPPPPPVAAPIEANAYLNLIQLVTKVLTEKTLSREQIDACVSAVDPALTLQLLSKRPDLCPQIAANIKVLAA